MKFPAFLTNRLCKLCEQHTAKFAFRGRVKRDGQHDICKRCFESLRDQMAAKELSVAENLPRSVSPANSPYFY